MRFAALVAFGLLLVGAAWAFELDAWTPRVVSEDLRLAGEAQPRVSIAVDSEGGRVYIATQNQNQDGKPWLLVCGLDGVNCNGFDISNGQGKYSGYLPSLAIDAASGKVFVATANQAQSGKPWLFICSLDGTSCTDHDISNEQGSASGNSPSLAIDAASGKVFVATANYAQSYKPWLFICSLDGTSCTDHDISNGQGKGSGSSPSLTIDAASGKVFVATTNGAQSNKPWLYICSLDGTSCTDHDISNGHGSSSGYSPSLAIDAASGKVFVATTNYAQTFKPWLYICSLDGTSCKDHDISNGHGQYSGGSPSLSLDLPGGRVYVATSNSGQSNKPWLFLCHLDGTDCVDFDASGGQATSSSLSLALAPGGVRLIASFPPSKSDLRLWLSLSKISMPFSPTTSYLVPPTDPVVGMNATFSLHLRDSNGSLPVLAPSFPLTSYTFFSFLSNGQRVHGSTTAVDASLITFDVLITFADHSLAVDLGGFSVGSWEADFTLDPAACALADAPALRSLEPGVAHSFVAQLRLRTGADLSVAPTYFPLPPAVVDVTLGTLPVAMAPFNPGRSDALITFESDVEQTLFLYIRVFGADIPGSPFAAVFVSNVPDHCLPGTRVASGVCVPCDLGTYSDTEMAPACTPCPDRTTTHAAGSSSIAECTCVAGAYILPPTTGVACLPCPTGGVCEGNTTAPFAERGFYASTSSSHFIQCASSLEEAEERCEGEDTCEPAYASRLCSQCAEGFYAANEACHKCKGDTGPGPLVAALLVISLFLVTLFAILLSEAGSAPAPREESARGLVRDWRWALGWAVRLWREALLMLTELAALIVLGFFGLRETFEVVVLALGFTVLTVYLTAARVLALRRADSGFFARSDLNASLIVNADDAEGEGLGMGGRLAETAAPEHGSHVGHAHHSEAIEHATASIESVIKTLIIYIQTLGAILMTFEAKWTSSMESVGAAIEHTGLQVSGLECNGLGFAGQFYFSLLLLPGVLALVGLVAGVVWIAATARGASPDRLAAIKTVALKMSLATAFFFVYKTCATCLAMFACVPEPIPNPGASYLARAPWIRCGSPEHTKLALVAGIVLVLVGGACVAVGLAVKRGRRNHHSVVGAAVGFLYESYVPRAWWFEAAVLARRVGIALFASVLPKDSVFAPVMLLFVLQTALMSAVLLRPFSSRVAFHLEIATLLACIGSLALVRNMAETSDPSSLNAMSALFIGGNGAVFAAAAVYTVLPLFSIASNVVREQVRKRRASTFSHPLS